MEPPRQRRKPPAAEVAEPAPQDAYLKITDQELIALLKNHRRRECTLFLLLVGAIGAMVLGATVHAMLLQLFKKYEPQMDTMMADGVNMTRNARQVMNVVMRLHLQKLNQAIDEINQEMAQIHDVNFTRVRKMTHRFYQMIERSVLHSERTGRVGFDFRLYEGDPYEPEKTVYKNKVVT